ncbi:Uncharacterized protein Fot_17983 [Forsythia ovata]|uniref:Uncharacterized protein n=1 Tax=Forsythia ovata TaxID=205694 RepID=A0ABD1VGW5_9LAMI
MKLYSKTLSGQFPKVSNRLNSHSVKDIVCGQDKVPKKDKGWDEEELDLVEMRNKHKPTSSLDRFVKERQRIIRGTLMAKSRSVKKSKRKHTFRRSGSATKRKSRGYNKEKYMQKKKVSVPVVQMEKDWDYIIHPDQWCLGKFAEYLYQKSISAMPNKFDTRMARYNMDVQLYKFAIEKPDIPLSKLLK